MVFGPRDEELDGIEGIADGGFILHAGLYLPRKQRVSEAVIRVWSDSRDELLKIIRERFVPLYETALSILWEMPADERGAAALYYWQARGESKGATNG